jgi:hypothetical protein
MWQKQLKDENTETTANNSEVNSTVGEASDSKGNKAEEEAVHKPNESDANVTPDKTFAQAAADVSETAIEASKDDDDSRPEEEEPGSPYTADDSPESPNESANTPDEVESTVQTANDGNESTGVDSAAGPAGQAGKTKKKKKKNKGKKN